MRIFLIRLNSVFFNTIKFLLPDRLSDLVVQSRIREYWLVDLFSIRI